jgi:hypothetical protein
MDLYLAFPNESTANSVLYRTVDGETYPNYANIDTIGVIYKRTGGTDDEPVMTAIKGWHVNVRVVDEDAEALQSFAMTPATPTRVWG